MNDRNKTALTHRITAVAAAYLEGLGCKPVETEVPVGRGWIADVATYWYPTNTGARRFQLDKRLQERLGITASDALRLIQYSFQPLTLLVEVKVSRSDFLGDSKWTKPPPAHLCLLAYPFGLIQPAEIPTGWHGLEMTKTGQKLRKVHRLVGSIHPQYPALVTDFVAQVGMRRDARTRWRAQRDWLKAYRAKETESRRRYSAADLLTCLADWLQGNGYQPDRDLRGVLRERGIKLPEYAGRSVDYFDDLKQRKTKRRCTCSSKQPGDAELPPLSAKTT